MILGIVGAEALKFTPAGKAQAVQIIRGLLAHPQVTGMSSGHCHLGGIDIWAEEIAEELGIKPYIFTPTGYTWPYFKFRNLKIADKSDEVHSIVVDVLPHEFPGLVFPLCYHHGKDDATAHSHVKSGGCWTMKKAIEAGKVGKLHIVVNYPPFV